MIIIDIETEGLHAITDKITCISCLNIVNGDVQSFVGADEKKLLEEFWDKYLDRLEVTTFNGESFDIPYIIKRSLINKIKMKKFGKSLDLRKSVNGFFYSYNKFEKGSLNDWSKILGLGEKTTDGLEMVKAAKEGNYQLIKEHCEEDVKLTYELYKRCVECNLI